MALQALGLTKQLRGQRVVDDVSLHVRRGDAYGLLGHNGAGKTTTLRMILGLLRPDRGRVLVEGIDAAQNPRGARAHLGGLIEVPGFQGGLSAAANLRALGRLQAIPAVALGSEVARCLEAVGLAKVGSKPVRAFSQGMRQRLGLAQALLGSPPYLLLDEPTNGLDPEGLAEMRELLRTLRREQGLTLVISSHQLVEIEGLCNRIAIMKEGRLLCEEETSRLLLAERNLHRVVAEPEAALLGQCAAMGLSGSAVEGGLHIELDDSSRDRLVRGLASVGASLRELVPIRPTLESVYLRLRRTPAGVGEGPLATQSTAAAETEPARPPRAVPSFPVLRVIAYELRRLFGSGAAWTFLVLPSALALAVIGQRAMAQRAALRAVESGELVTATQATGFEALGLGLEAGLPLLVLVLAGLASQSVAAEHAHGTLRNLLLRPLTRWQIGLGKLLASLLHAGVSFAVLALAAYTAARAYFGFGDLVEVLPNGEPFPLMTAEELGRLVPRLLRSPLLPMAAYVGLGFLAGTLVRRSAGALSLALIAALLLDLAKVIARSQGFEGWLPSAYVPSALGDRSSFVQHYLKVVTNVGNTSFSYESLATVAPASFLLATALVALWALQRRSVP